jgi:hypothetical protein
VAGPDHAAMMGHTQFVCVRGENGTEYQLIGSWLEPVR